MSLRYLWQAWARGSDYPSSTRVDSSSYFTLATLTTRVLDVG